MTVDKKTDISKAASDTKSIIFNKSECMCRQSIWTQFAFYVPTASYLCWGHGSGGKRASCASRKCWVPRTYINLGVAIYACPTSWRGRRHSWKLANNAQWDELEYDRGGCLLFSGLWKYLHSCAPMYTNNHITENMFQALCLKYFRTFFLLGKYHAPTQTHFL